MLNKRRVVVTGLGAVTSLGDEIKDIWNKLLKGESGISKITKFDTKDFPCKIAGEVKNFDPSKYISQRELRRLDPFSQYAIVAAHKAIEDSKLELDKENLENIGIIIGVGMGGMTEVDYQQGVIKEKGPRRVSPFFIPKVMVNAPSAQISIKYGIKGVTFCTSSACSSGGHAIGQALRMIQYGEADVIITGGTEAIIVPLSVAGFCSARALSQRNDEPTKASRPFDKERDGFVMGEGSAILILEEYEHAKRRNAKIYAELLGIGWNSDGFHITQPSPNGIGAVNAIKKALKDAKISYEKIDYINAHGTSTIQNDKTETQAIKEVFKDYAYKIPISSTKSMIGHLIGAAGAIESLVTVLSVFENKIHPTINYEYPDPECDLDYVPNQGREVKVNYALSNSFGFGGHNVCLIFSKIE